jgi:hypothetical protein
MDEIDELRSALDVFEYLSSQKSDLPQKTRLKILCRGHAAASRGWRLLADGEGDEKEIFETLKEVSIQLQGNATQRRGAKKRFLSRTDDAVLRRYFERDPLDLPLRHFVAAAFDEGILDRNIRIDVHVVRLQRCLDKHGVTAPPVLRF